MTILRVAGLTDLFQALVDGLEVARMEMRGKPDPAMFLEAARRLNVPPLRGVVFEDATAGVPGPVGDAVWVNAMHCLAPSVRVAVNGETYDIAASGSRTFLLK